MIIHRLPVNRYTGKISFPSYHLTGLAQILTHNLLQWNTAKLDSHYKLFFAHIRFAH